MARAQPARQCAPLERMVECLALAGLTGALGSGGTAAAALLSALDADEEPQAPVHGPSAHDSSAVADADSTALLRLLVPSHDVAAVMVHIRTVSQVRLCASLRLTRLSRR